MKLVLIIALTFYLGWRFAHKEVAEECVIQGTFYVDNQTFECKEKRP